MSQLGVLSGAGVTAAAADEARHSAVTVVDEIDDAVAQRLAAVGVVQRQFQQRHRTPFVVQLQFNSIKIFQVKNVKM